MRQVIEATADESGRVTSEGVVAAASDPSHPLHDDPKFFWNDERAAAHEYRLQYAAKLIRKVYIVVRPTERRQARVAYFVRSPRTMEKEAGHVPLQSIEPASENAVIVVRDEARQLVGVLKRMAAIAAVLESEVADDVRRLLSGALQLQGKLAAPVAVEA